MKKLLFFVVIFLFSPGCKKQKYSSVTQEVIACEQEEYLFDFARQQEARLADIPIPLNAKPIPKKFWADTKESAGFMLSYLVNKPLQEIASFYSQEMERFGWDQVVFLGACEYFLSFEKPGRVCSVLLRPAGTDISLTVFIAQKSSFS